MFRPDDVGKIFGQDHIQEILISWVENRENIPQSVLFCGPYGVGKTSIARVVAKLIITNSDDLMEINASDARGIDDVRSWAEAARFSPFGDGGRVYIIDELHQMTTAAQSALLKVIEEPPPRIYFFLCTTEPGKLLPPLRSRCTELELKLFKLEDTINLLSFVCNGKFDNQMIEAIHNKTGGHARDAVKMAELALLSGVETVEELQEQVGLGIKEIEDGLFTLIKYPNDSGMLIDKLLAVEDERALGFTIDDTVDILARQRNQLVQQNYHQFLQVRSLRRDYKINAKEQLLHLISLL